jgi:hypothetical protein
MNTTIAESAFLMAGPIISKIAAVALITAAFAVVPGRAVSADQSWPADGTFIRITRDGGLSPFLNVYYDVTVRGKTLVITMVKDTLCRVVTRERVVLQDGEDAVRTIARLRAAGAWTVEMPAGAARGRAADTASSPDQARYEFWMAEGRDMTRFFMSRDVMERSSALAGLRSVLRDIVTGVVEPLPMRDVFHPADETGVVAITSSESAVAVIDGWDRVRLPVSALDLKVGIHDVVVTGKSGATRNFTLRIAPGENAAVHVLLGDSPVQPGTAR